MGVELPLRVIVTILECCVTFSGVKLSIRSFVLFSGTMKISSEFRDFKKAFMNFAKSINAHISAKFHYFANCTIFSMKIFKLLDCVLTNSLMNISKVQCNFNPI